VSSRRQFIQSLPESERNILFTRDPDQEFDPYSCFWIYEYPELAIQNPVIQENFQHILQFEGNFDLEEILPLDQENQRRKGRPQGSKNLKQSLKNTAAP
jgi:hypothetical protein